FSNGPRADAYSLRDGLRRLPALDLQYNPLSTARRQPGILMHVHPVLRWNLKLQQPQLPRSEPDGQPTESSQLGRYRAPSDVLVLSRSVFSMRDRMEAISATARIHHTSCRRCPCWTVDGYRSDTQGLPPRYADRGSADESR